MREKDIRRVKLIAEPNVLILRIRDMSVDQMRALAHGSMTNNYERLAYDSLLKCCRTRHEAIALTMVVMEEHAVDGDTVSVSEKLADFVQATTHKDARHEDFGADDEVIDRIVLDSSMPPPDDPVIEITGEEDDVMMLTPVPTGDDDFAVLLPDAEPILLSRRIQTPEYGSLKETPVSPIRRLRGLDKMSDSELRLYAHTTLKSPRDRNEFERLFPLCQNRDDIINLISMIITDQHPASVPPARDRRVPTSPGLQPDATFAAMLKDMTIAELKRLAIDNTELEKRRAVEAKIERARNKEEIVHIVNHIMYGRREEDTQ